MTIGNISGYYPNYSPYTNPIIPSVRPSDDRIGPNAVTPSEETDEHGKVVNASVSIHTSICPECGRTYVSGGVTHTQIKYSNEDNPYTKNQKELDAAKFKGANIDYAA